MPVVDAAGVGCSGTCQDQRWTLSGFGVIGVNGYDGIPLEVTTSSVAVHVTANDGAAWPEPAPGIDDRSANAAVGQPAPIVVDVLDVELVDVELLDVLDLALVDVLDVELVDVALVDVGTGAEVELVDGPVGGGGSGPGRTVVQPTATAAATSPIGTSSRPRPASRARRTGAGSPDGPVLGGRGSVGRAAAEAERDMEAPPRGPRAATRRAAVGGTDGTGGRGGWGGARPDIALGGARWARGSRRT